MIQLLLTLFKPPNYLSFNLLLYPLPELILFSKDNHYPMNFNPNPNTLPLFPPKPSLTSTSKNSFEVYSIEIHINSIEFTRVVVSYDINSSESAHIVVTYDINSNEFIRVDASYDVNSSEFTRVVVSYDINSSLFMSYVVVDDIKSTFSPHLTNSYDIKELFSI